MTRSATDVMQDVIYAAVIDAIGALKAGAGGLPNNLLRDINAIHANSTFADLPEAMRKAIEENVRAAFTRLLKEGYSVASKSAPPLRRALTGRPPRGPQDRGGPPRPPVVRGGRPPKSSGSKPRGGGGGKPR